MPALAAHYQFGALVFEKLPKPIQEIITPHREHYDVGTQGPDILFYHDVFKKDEVVDFGNHLHTLSGASFFLEIWDKKSSWSKELLAYLCGFCAHFTLDKNCHPYVNEYAPTGDEHIIMESAFDKIIVDKYSLTHKRHKFIPNKNLNYLAVQGAYPTLNAEQISKCINSMRKSNRLLNHPNLVSFIEKILKKQGKFKRLCMPNSVEPGHLAHNLTPLFENAVEECATYIKLIYDKNTAPQEIINSMSYNFEGIAL